MKDIEKLLVKALAEALNFRGPHRTPEQNHQMQVVADKIADALGDIRFMGGAA